MRRAGLALVLLVLASCKKQEATPQLAGLPVARNIPFTDLTVTFLDPGAYQVPTGKCAKFLFTPGKGQMVVHGEGLLEGAALLVTEGDRFTVTVPPGSVGVVVREGTPCATRETLPEQVFRYPGADKLAWANGTMEAHFDVLDDKLPFYLGRLSGTAPVAEHVHADSVEILLAIEAAGTFILDGKEERLAPQQIVSVPKGTKHSYRPDPGAKLVAVQLYAPKGPQERFRALADGGAPALAPTPSH